MRNEERGARGEDGGSRADGVVLAPRSWFLAAAIALAAGCGPPPPLGAVYLEVGPPPPRVEVIEVRREPGYVLIPGYWARERGTYVWMSPRWTRPPHRHAKWVRPRWHRDRRGWYWVPGHWK